MLPSLCSMAFPPIYTYADPPAPHQQTTSCSEPTVICSHCPVVAAGQGLFPCWMTNAVKDMVSVLTTEPRLQPSVGNRGRTPNKAAEFNFKNR